MEKTVKIKIKTDSYSIVKKCLVSAAERACRRTDKYCEPALTESQRATLIQEFENSFWLAMDDHNAEIV